MAGEEGLEPPTHWLTVSCANQLRYTPICVVRWEHDSESTMLSAILPIPWEVLKIHFSADVPRPRTSLIDSLGTSRRGTLCISFTLLIYYNIFFFENQICYNWLSYQDGFFSIFPNALPVELSPHICCFRLFMEKVVRRKAIRAYHFLYLTYILYHIFFEKSKKIFLT